MKSAKFVFFALAVVLIAACSTYKAKPQLRYYHGRNVPEGYIKILRASAREIEFQIQVEFAERKLCHLVLEGDNPVAGGWFSTLRAAAGRGRLFQSAAGPLSSAERQRLLTFSISGSGRLSPFSRFERISYPDMLFECRSLWLFMALDIATRSAIQYRHG
jgi:hypothetical protein